MKKNWFITFEGIEGSGKSTQIELFRDFLEKKGYSTIVTREPGGTLIGDQIRNILLNPDNKKMEPITEAYLYAASRIQLIREIILPALEEGQFVLCDRYVDSSYAYQGYGRELSLDEIMSINKYAIEKALPDLTFLLYLPTEDGLRRATALEADRIEREAIEFHQQVQNGFLELAEKFPERIKIVEADGEIMQIHQKIVELFQEELVIHGK